MPAGEVGGTRSSSVENGDVSAADTSVPCLPQLGVMTEPRILWRKVKCARCSDTYWVCETHDIAPGTASMRAAAVRRECRVPTATHPTRIIRRARRGASSATKAWMTDDDRRAIPSDPRAAGDDGHLAGSYHRHPAGACVGISLNRAPQRCVGHSDRTIKCAVDDAR